MSDAMDWLPPLHLLEDHGGDWTAYVEAVYGVFRKDFVASRPAFRGRPMKLKVHPISEGREATFWHFVSEGNDEQNRVPDLRRCERIGWPRPIIEAVDSGRVRCWEQTRQTRTGNKRIALATEDFSYIVILEDGGTYVLPWTAFPVEWDNARRRKRKEYEEWVAQKR